MTCKSPLLSTIASSLFVLFSLLSLAHARTQRMEPVPKELEEVGVTEHLDAPLPLQLEFTDENGRTVALGDYFTGERPVILTLNYYECPMLCTLQLNGLVKGLKKLPWLPAKEYEVVTVSINPAEGADLAKAKKKVYTGLLGKPEAAQGWHFLTGKQDSITALTRAVGFRYRYDKETNQFAHAAVSFVITPGGRLSRYLYGIEYSGQTLRLALVEAAKGKIGSSFDQFLLYCYHYDASRGRYAPVAVNIMRIGGLLTMIALVILLGGYWLRDSRAKRANRV